MRYPPAFSLRASCAVLAAAASLSIASAQIFGGHYVEGRSKITTPQLTILKSKSGTVTARTQWDDLASIDYESFVASSDAFPGSTVIGLRLKNLQMNDGTNQLPVYLKALRGVWDYRYSWYYDGALRPVTQDVYLVSNESVNQKFTRFEGGGDLTPLTSGLEVTLGNPGRNPDYFYPGDELSLLFVSSYAESIVDSVIGTSARPVGDDSLYANLDIPFYRPEFVGEPVPEPSAPFLMMAACMAATLLLARRSRCRKNVY